MEVATIYWYWWWMTSAKQGVYSFHRITTRSQFSPPHLHDARLPYTHYEL